MRWTVGAAPLSTAVWTILCCSHTDPLPWTIKGMCLCQVPRWHRSTQPHRSQFIQAEKHMLCSWNYCCLSSTVDEHRQKSGRAVRIFFTSCKSHFHEGLLLSSKVFLLLFNKDQWPQKPRVLPSQKHQHPDRVPLEQFSSSAEQDTSRQDTIPSLWCLWAVPSPAPMAWEQLTLQTAETWGGSA